MMSEAEGLACKALTTGYDRRAGATVSGASLQFAPGRFTALLGANGCGKSTLLRALMGFLPAWEGTATLDGVSVDTIPRRRMARRLAYLPQDSQCPDYLTVGELIDLGAHSRGGWFRARAALPRARAEDLLAEVGLEGCGPAQVNQLSGGQRQRAFLAMVLAQDAEILLLDEPVNHLDIRYQYEVLALVRALMARRHRTVIAVLHDLNLAGAFADDVALMQSGRTTAHGSTAEILTADRIASVWGITGEVVAKGGRLSFLPDIPGTAAGSTPVQALRVIR